MVPNDKKVTDLCQKMDRVPLHALPMNAILCDIVAWMYFASKLPATSIPAAESQELLAQASSNVACAKAVRSQVWWESQLAFAHSLLGTPPTHEVPLHFLTLPVNRAGKQNGVVTHQYTAMLPGGFLFNVKPPVGLDSLQVVGPAGYLALRAREVDEVHLAVLISNLCGDYFCLPHKDACAYFKQPLCSTQTIAQLARSFSAKPLGIKRLITTMCYVANNAHSPMETVVQLALSLPKKLGGCGLPTPELNATIEVEPKLSYLLGGSKAIKPDGLWANHHLVYEYDSNQEHDENKNQIRKDRQRRDVMERLGYTVVTMDSTICKDEVRRNLIFERIANILGYSFDWSGQAQIRRRDLWARLMLTGMCW